MTRFMSCPKLGGAMSVAAFMLISLMSPARGQVTAPSLYTDALQVQGEAAGTEFADWVLAGVTVADADPLDNPDSLDIANVQVANDDQFLYIRATTHQTAAVSLGNLYLAFDTDQDTSTGFNVFSLGVIGSELGYQTDFPFAQHASAFNLGLSLTGGPIGNGGALIYPFWTEAGPPEGTEIEWAIPLDAVIQFPPALGGPAPAFPNPSFDFVVYTSEGLSDVTNVISYTLADPADAPGDFDHDQDVDGADFLVWQQGFPSTHNAGDLADWKANFGVAPAIAAVPEPAAVALAAWAACLVGGRRRRARD